MDDKPGHEQINTLHPEQESDAKQEAAKSADIIQKSPDLTIEDAAAAHVYDQKVKSESEQPVPTFHPEQESSKHQESASPSDIVPQTSEKSVHEPGAAEEPVEIHGPEQESDTIQEAATPAGIVPQTSEEKAVDAAATHVDDTKVKSKRKQPDRQVKKQKEIADEKLILDHIERFNQLNQTMSEIEDEADLNKLLVEENQLLADFILLLRSTGIERLSYAVQSKQLDFLNSRLAINRERGNELAVQRDQVKLAYYKTNQSIREFVNYLIKASKDYVSIDKIIMETEKALEKNRLLEKNTTFPEEAVDSNVYADLEKNYLQFQMVSNTYQDILDYVIDNPREIATSHWFQQFTLLSAISYFNAFDFIKSINHKLAPFRLDVGGVIVSLIIFSLVFISFPFVFKFSSWFIESYVLEKGVEEQELIYHELRRPIRFLLMFFGIDLATYALFYKAKFRGPLEDVAYVIYAFIFVWFLFRVLDTVVLAHFHKMSQTNKGLRKELINLSIQFSKGGLIIVAMVFVFNHFGISVTAIVSTLGIGGLAFALAAKDTLSNFFGGVTILFDNVFKMGDWVKIDQVEGTVAEIGLRSTTIRTFDNSLITVPNSTISVSGVMNWNRRAIGRRIKMYIGVTYESDMDDIRQALADIRTMLSEHPGIANPKEKHTKKGRRYKFSSQEDAQGIKATQLVYLDRYNDFSIDILIYCFSKTVVWSEWLAVKEDVLFKIAEILEKNNLQFAYPTAVRLHRMEGNHKFYQGIGVDSKVDSLR